MADRKAQLTVDGLDKPLEFPVYSGTAGPDVVDVRSLIDEGLFTYDPGFVATAATESSQSWMVVMAASSIISLIPAMSVEPIGDSLSN